MEKKLRKTKTKRKRNIVGSETQGRMDLIARKKKFSPKAMETLSLQPGRFPPTVCSAARAPAPTISW